MTKSMQRTPVRPFSNKEEEDAFIEKGLLWHLERHGARSFTFKFLRREDVPAPGVKGIGLRELRRVGAKTPEQIEKYLLQESNRGRHLGKKAIRRILKGGAVR